MKIMHNVGQIMNLKDNKCIFEDEHSSKSIPLSCFLQVHIFQRPEDSDDDYRDKPTK